VPREWKHELRKENILYQHADPILDVFFPSLVKKQEASIKCGVYFQPILHDNYLIYEIIVMTMCVLIKA
jgi:hypothetical protein